MQRRKMPVHLRLVARSMPYKGLLLLGLASSVATSAMFVATPEIVRFTVDTGFAISDVTQADGTVIEVVEGNMGTLAIAASLLLVTGVLRGIFQYIQNYLNEAIGQKVAYDLRNEIFDHLQRLSFAYHDNAEVGQVMSRATQDVEGVRMFIGMGVVRLVYVGILIGASAYMMFLTNVTVAFAALALMPLVAIQASVIAVKMRPMWMTVQNLQGQVSTVLQENLTGQRVVKAFARQDYEQQKFEDRTEELFKRSYLTNVIQAVNEPVLLGLWLLSAALTFIVGAGEIRAGNLSAGEMASFQLYLTFLQQPVRMLGFIVNNFARAHSSGTRVFELLDAESAVSDKLDAQPLRPGPGDVRFEHVAFGYNSVAPVLRDISLHAQPGEVVALLGPTGSGKSTVVSLLPRFYDVTEGAILIDGQDIRDVTTDSLRTTIGVVQQDVFLFPTTIRENIRYGRPDATDGEVEDAAKAARIHEFIETLPEGYDTVVGERGSTLSGGQRQRVAIARTVLLDPRVLVFDDSTSSVDMRTEYLIQEALRNLMEGRTTFVIAQRLRTVQMADQILVLKDGEIVEQGTHAELLDRGGLYQEIYDLELRDQEEARAEMDVAGSS
ncbi:MAG: ATP-binding cassette domain-containing protein [Dehalococcoidia bacterium]|nr:ATP-binding cassette domain-containing protein [Dehalococcoidia bacterium]